MIDPEWSDYGILAHHYASATGNEGVMYRNLRAVCNTLCGVNRLLLAREKTAPN